MPLQTAIAVAAALLSFTADGNRMTLTLDRGAADVTWINESTFRFRRTLEGRLPQWTPANPERVPFQVKETPEDLLLSSRLIEVSISKRQVLVSVRQLEGKPLMRDAAPPAAVAGGVEWTRDSPEAPFYGLGPRTEPEFDLRGKLVDTDRPFLLSGAGYGEYHPVSGRYRFDFRDLHSYRIAAPAIDYYFFFGPTYKLIFQHLLDVRPRTPEWKVNEAGPVSWTTLRDSLFRMTHAALSAELDPYFDLVPYAKAPPELAARARQLGSLVPKVTMGPLGLSEFRQQLETVFSAYVPDVEYHGYPMWHAMPFQFPSDPECGRHADEFMLGDEMLVAPIYDASGKRSLYLPQGNWTNLETNEQLRGRQAITVETNSLPVFARNGSIVPLDSANGMALHYFPTLAAEFFLLEDDIRAYSQVHAAPSADEMRLEIESAKDRDYEWVVHHVDCPAAVGFGDRQFRRVESARQTSDGTWYYDERQRNLHVRVSVKAGQDSVVDLRK